MVLAQEALGLTFIQTLDSSYALIEALIQEYAYLCNERNKSVKNEDGEEEGKDYEWIELPSWDDPTQMVRIKRYYDIGESRGKE